MNESTVTIQGVEAKPGVSKKTGNAYTKFDIQTSGGTFGTFDTALADQARAAVNRTVSVTYEENQYGKDLKSVNVDSSVPAAAPYVEPVRSVTPSGDTDWDMIGLRKTRCALWAALFSGAADITVEQARAFVIAAEVDIFHRPPASASSDVPF